MTLNTGAQYNVLWVSLGSRVRPNILGRGPRVFNIFLIENAWRVITKTKKNCNCYLMYYKYHSTGVLF